MIVFGDIQFGCRGNNIMFTVLAEGLPFNVLHCRRCKLIEIIFQCQKPFNGTNNRCVVCDLYSEYCAIAGTADIKGNKNIAKAASDIAKRLKPMARFYASVLVQDTNKKWTGPFVWSMNANVFRSIAFHIKDPDFQGVVPHGFVTFNLVVIKETKGLWPDYVVRFSSKRASLSEFNSLDDPDYNGFILGNVVNLDTLVASWVRSSEDAIKELNIAGLNTRCRSCQKLSVVGDFPWGLCDQCS
jgi:hypothetical protein